MKHWSRMIELILKYVSIENIAKTLESYQKVISL